MKKIFFNIVISLLLVQQSNLQSCEEFYDCKDCYEWAIIGAGFAGITSLAILLDLGADPSKVAWIDPEFNVGRVGKYYRDVPGNIQAKHLTEYVENCPFFKDINSPSLDKLYTYEPEQFQCLHVIVDPLLDFTSYLQNRVIPIKDCVTSLARIQDYWVLHTSDGTINAKKVILAIGAHPRCLDYEIAEIPLDDAFDKDKLAQYLSPDDCVAVFGSMHSAMLVLKNLCECCFLKQIVNFYIQDYFYGSPGLEGATAKWAQNVLENNPPAHLIRVLNTDENREKFLTCCTKAIYAVGYEANKILVNDSYELSFDENTGIIDEDLYGIGIAFPPTGIFNGQKIAKNGLFAYLMYAKKLMPRWIGIDKAYSTEEIEIPWI
jgi:hypothetical protein